VADDALAATAQYAREAIVSLGTKNLPPSSRRLRPARTVAENSDITARADCTIEQLGLGEILKLLDLQTLVKLLALAELLGASAAALRAIPRVSSWASAPFLSRCIRLFDRASTCWPGGDSAVAGAVDDRVMSLTMPTGAAIAYLPASQVSISGKGKVLLADHQEPPSRAARVTAPSRSPA
jgi:hypothetical protein